MGGFTATLDDCTAFRKALAVVGDLVESGNFVADAAGLSFQSVDGAHVALVTLDMPAECFSSYAPAGEVVFGVHLASLNRAFGCSTAGKKVRLTVSDAAVTLDFDAATFTVGLLDIESERVDVRSVEAALVIDAESAAFQRIVKDLAAFGDVARISAAGAAGAVELSAAGDHGTARVRLDPSTVVTASEPVRAEFSLKYLVSFAKAAGVSGGVRLETSPDMPLFVTYGLGAGRLTFVLAPKIADDE